ncbi:histidinol-phosphate transaminase [Marivibrio halodurans]|uniref:Histidinol-phosphate aminotransferase n=1 Tax=Marivibrio halodurans TaxID=2039722 RepID=A0A8J7V248_9PROT|nr:histidinol-phosphate transaminase [Marivibrio halodurans]MBP5856482.1 histidinol-phosphate transaminase [Marivibrio halodurans]
MNSSQADIQNDPTTGAPMPRPGVMDAPLYVPGTHKAGDDPAILSANENPLGCSPAAVEAFRAAAPHLNRYPEGGSVELRQAIGAVHGLDPAHIVCGAGSDELITLLIRAYAGPGDEVLYSRHGFLMYPITARTVGAVPVAAPESNLATDVDQMLAHVTERTRIVFVANPNNPTGSWVPARDLERLRAGLPEHVLLVLDSAYAEYVEADGYDDGRRLVEAGRNTVMTRTFSKIYGLAALRLGWCYAPANVVDVLNRLRSPFNINAAAQAAGLAAVRDQDFVKRSIAENAAQRLRLTQSLQQLGLDVPPSVCNFVLAGFADEETATAANAYLLSRGVIVRVMAAYGLPRYLRVTVGTSEEVTRLLDGIADFLQR